MVKAEKIKKIADCYLEKVSGRLGFGYYDLESGEAVFVNEKEVFPAASVFKVFILAELFRQIEVGILQLDTRYELKYEYQTMGSGVLANMNCGVTPTLYDYALLMMIISDNTAADFLFDLVGRNNIRHNVINALGLHNTRADLTCAQLINQYCECRPGQSFAEITAMYYHNDYRNTKSFTCQTDENDVTSPGDMVRMLKAIYDHSWVNSEVCKSMLDIMKQCQTNSRIPKYLPAGTVVAHKTGSFDRVGNDAGIVFTDKGDYILTLFYNGNTASEEEYFGENCQGYFGDEILAHLSREVFDAYMKS